MAETEPTTGGFGIPYEEAEPPRRRRWLWWFSVTSMVFVLVLVVGLGVFVHGANAYAREFDGRLLPGTVIEGVHVGGMTPKEALAAVDAVVRPELQRVITVRWSDRTWQTTPAELGSTSDASEIIADAVANSGGFRWQDFARMRWLGDRIDYTGDVTITHDRDAVEEFVADLAGEVEVEAVDAELDYSTGWVQVSPDKIGYDLDATQSASQLLEVVKSGETQSRLVVEQVQPEVTTEAFRQVILLRQSDFRVYLYNNGEITHSWPVAIGQARYPTPRGVFEVTKKRHMPTWVNPSPDTWGKHLPRRIGPGPHNPLGVRALNWSAPAIRFHGTAAVGSIGRRASHGCVRLTNGQIVELYDLVDVGTPIVSIWG